MNNDPSLPGSGYQSLRTGLMLICPAGDGNPARRLFGHTRPVGVVYRTQASMSSRRRSNKSLLA